MKHQFKKVGEFYIQLEQTDMFNYPTIGKQNCAQIYPDNTGRILYKVIVNKNDTILSSISKNQIKPNDTINFIDLSDSKFNQFKWKFKHFSVALNKYLEDSVVTSNKIITKSFSDTGIYDVIHSAWDINNLNNCVTNSTHKFKVDNSNLNTKSIDQNQWLSVSPNPVKDYLRLTIHSKLRNQEFKIVDFSGRIVKHGPITKTIDVSNLASGPYFIIVENIVVKFVKTQ